MPQELEIRGAVIRSNIRSKEIPRFLADQISDLAVFEFRAKPGAILGAAFDWVAILSTTADLISVATALWMAYEELIKTHRKKTDDDNPPKFFVQVKSGRGTSVQFTIQDGQEREVFITEFTEHVSHLRHSEEAAKDEALLEVFERSDTYVRIK